jgi:hypothetical protein
VLLLLLLWVRSCRVSPLLLLLALQLVLLQAQEEAVPAALLLLLVMLHVGRLPLPLLVMRLLPLLQGKHAQMLARLPQLLLLPAACHLQTDRTRVYGSHQHLLPLLQTRHHLLPAPGCCTASALRLLAQPAPSAAPTPYAALALEAVRVPPPAACWASR